MQTEIALLGNESKGRNNLRVSIGVGWDRFAAPSQVSHLENIITPQIAWLN